jgi:hypothetical protein
MAASLMGIFYRTGALMKAVALSVSWNKKHAEPGSHATARD